MNPTTRRFSATLLSVVAGTLALGACDRDDSRTAGQRVDDTVAKVERQADEVAADVRAAGRDARQAAQQAAGSIGSKSKDLAITAEVNARLASDPELSALSTRQMQTAISYAAVFAEGDCRSAIAFGREAVPEKACW